MISKTILKNKYNNLISSDKETFITNANKIYKLLVESKVDIDKPLLVRGNNNRNELVYALGINYSLKSKRVLDYVVITALHFIEQHFLEAEHRNMELYQKLYSTDILVITLNNYDTRGGSYADAVLINLVETRELNNKTTIVYAENVKDEYPELIRYIINKQKPINLGNNINDSKDTKRRKIF